MKEIKGIIVPILTPMHEDETVNYEELVNQIERLIAAGVHGIFVFGTNGEGYILDEEEKAEIIRVAVKAVSGPCRFTQARAASAPVIRFACPEKPRNWVRMYSPLSHQVLPRLLKKRLSAIMRRLQTQWICRSCCTTSPPAQATLWPLPQCKSCLRWQTLWAQRIPAVTLTISCSISRKHAGAINRSPCCPATIP